jgi:prevent-host-death family protein
MIEARLSLEEAAEKLGEAVDRARRLGESTLLTEGGRPVARVVPVASENQSLEALADWWATHERLDTEEAASFEADLRKVRESVPPPTDPWD